MMRFQSQIELIRAFFCPESIKIAFQLKCHSQTAAYRSVLPIVDSVSPNQEIIIIASGVSRIVSNPEVPGGSRPRQTHRPTNLSLQKQCKHHIKSLTSTQSTPLQQMPRPEIENLTLSSSYVQHNRCNIKRMQNLVTVTMIKYSR